MFGRVIWYGDIDLPGDGTPKKATLAIPPGSYDSGLIELVFDAADGANAGVILRSVQLEDTNFYPKPAAYGM
jgi:hypothetical protein